MSMWQRCPATLSLDGPAVASGHLGRGAGFVDEDEALGLQLWLGLEPGQPPLPDVRPLLLGGVRRFF